ncbi:tripartite tricarboxylate transporter TctB family protein [Klebsiella pasteurii]|uniref:tripartite tricarboxylate transporter TctB family protein n=1 Tax=Klebsiella pasteurii TaxID=2587529 RepID=UPI00237A6974|nr:tripartite tricarboxylate transporter TctB family protein [Klebsiella pasteurii]MDD9652074.1 tripartite tricarboxylate transporter TctB family protein [Klebsiella pasteurii]
MRALPLTPFIILIFAITIFSISVTEYGGIGQHGAGFMPTLISGLLLFLTAIDAAIDIKNRGKRQSLFSLAECKALTLVIIVVMLFVFLLETLGFVICAFLLLFILMKMRGVKLLLAAGTSIAASLIIYYVFARVLLVAFPAGIWF